MRPIFQTNEKQKVVRRKRKSLEVIEKQIKVNNTVEKGIMDEEEYVKLAVQKHSVAFLYISDNIWYFFYKYLNDK